MHQDLSATTISHGSDETEEPVLVEAQEFSEDEENFADEEDEENHSDFDYDENEEEEEEEEEEDIEFEDDEDEDDMLSKGLHDINTLRHLYRFGLLQTEQIRPHNRYPPSNELNNKISIWRGDITQLGIPVIVNAANKSLLGGGGVDGAIHKAAGRALLRDCRALMGCMPGDAKITNGYNLPAKRVIHTVGPVYYSDAEKSPILLASCYRKCLDLAKKHSLTSIAFPSLSTGVYGYPIQEATAVAARAVRKWLDAPTDPESESSPPNSSVMERVIFCVFSAKDEEVYNEIVPHFFPPTEEDLAAEKEQETEDESDSELTKESEQHTI